MNMSGEKIWKNGEFIDAESSATSLLTQTLHYGFGLFEGIRCYKLSNGGSAIFRLRDHIKRMINGTKILSMDMPFTEDQLFDAHIKTVQVNGFEECYIRPIVYAGVGSSFGLAADNPTEVAIIARKWGTYLGEGALDLGIRAKVSSFNRHHVNVAMVQGKICGQYVTSVLAKREVVKDGYDEAIMLDTNGYVAECSGENIFTVKDGVLRTPPLTSPILAGITRDSIIQLAKNMNIEVREETFTRDYMYLCDEVFLCGTAAEVTPVREIDNRPIGSGKAGEMTRRIQKAYFDAVRGLSGEYGEWLAKI